MRAGAIAAAAIAAAVAAAPAPAQTVAEQARLAAVHARGMLLYRIDRAAWVATDDFRKQESLRADKSLRGYVVERAPGGFTVTFFAEEGGRLVRAYVADVAQNKVVRSQVFTRGRRTPLSAVQIRLAAARRLAARPDFRSCTGPFNITPIPPASANAPMEVYFLSPQVRNGEYPFGGHFRMTLAANGKRLSARKFSNACLNMPAPPPGGVLGIAHVLDPIPTEIHVFSALSAKTPVLVVTGNRTWQIDGRSITLAGSN